MNKIELISTGVKLISGIGITKIVNSACKSVIPKSTNVFDSICTNAGIFCMTGAVEMAADAYVDKLVKDFEKISTSIHVEINKEGENEDDGSEG